MELQTFVSESLAQIVAGIRSAQDIEPTTPATVEFDVAVTIETEHDGEVAKLTVSSMVDADSTVNRIRFSVPIHRDEEAAKRQRIALRDAV